MLNLSRKLQHIKAVITFQRLIKIYFTGILTIVNQTAIEQKLPYI